MSLTELLTSAQYLTDAEGNKKAVVLDLAAWEEILTLLEDVTSEARTERVRVQNEHLRHLLQSAPEDDKGPEWWDEFEQELRQNRLTFPEREII
jgi:hypothetical protein